MDPDETFDPNVEEPEEELTFNDLALKNAVRRNMSIWRSHGTTGERMKYSATDDEDDNGDKNDESESEVASGLAAETENDSSDEEWCCDDSTMAGNLVSFFSLISSGRWLLYIILCYCPSVRSPWRLCS